MTTRARRYPPKETARELDGKHGTQTGYVYGCRETCCREAHAAVVAGWRREPGKRYPNRRVHLDDVEWLASFGEHPDTIAQRLGVHRDSLYQALRRHGRADLWARLMGQVA